jgi:hypothetical protein
MRRPTTATVQSQGHPFRNRMNQVRVEVQRRDDDSDIKLFALSFTAFFICFYTFLL